MRDLSRREFLFFSSLLFLSFPLKGYAITLENNGFATQYPNTIWVLKQALLSEMIAHKHYLEYVKIAQAEKYPNIAYMFQAFSISEKIHADNYNRIIKKLGDITPYTPILVKSGSTKSNLLKAAQKELEKIEKTYPDFIKKVKTESCDDAIVNLMYSWKSHRQHEEKIKKIQKYSEYFFGSVTKEIEGMVLDIHVCEICGSTIDEAPSSPCDICNKAMSHYNRVNRPSE